MKFTTLLFLLMGLPASATFINPTDLREDLVSSAPTQIDQAEFDQRIAELNTAYAPLVRQHGGRLSLKGDWGNDRIVARATQMFGSWKIEFSGGLARRPELTGDGMSLIICHEIGHHLAGFPFSAGGPFGGYWASVEGQADYYSTHVCAKKLWETEIETNATFRTSVDPVARASCDAVYVATPERDLCYRTSQASTAVIKTMAALMNRPAPQLPTPDQNVRAATVDGHPAIQCRYDTLFQGGLCPTAFDDRLIPGKRTPAGRDSLDAEREAALVSCAAMGNFTQGLRPACWFKARL